MIPITSCFASFDALQTAHDSADPGSKTVQIYKDGDTSGRSKTFKVTMRNDRGHLTIFSGSVEGIGQTVHIAFHTTNHQHESTTIGL